jgi:hypothetical protein
MLANKAGSTPHRGLSHALNIDMHANCTVLQGFIQTGNCTLLHSMRAAHFPLLPCAICYRTARDSLAALAIKSNCFDELFV